MNRISFTFICQEKAPNEALFRLHMCEWNGIYWHWCLTQKKEEPDVSYMYAVYM